MQRLVGQDQLVHRHIGRDRQSACLRLGDHLCAARRGQLAEMRTHAGLLHQQQVAGQGDGFGRFGNPRQAEEGRRRTFMGDAAFGQIAIQGVDDHGEVEGGRILQCAPQAAVVGEVRQAVAERHAAGLA